MTEIRDRVIYYFDKHAEVISGTFYDTVFIAKERMVSNGQGYEIMMSFPWWLAKIFKYLLANGIGKKFFIKLAKNGGSIFKTLKEELR